MNTRTEPISVTEAVRSLVLAVLAVLTTFGVIELTDEQTGAILALIAVASVALSAFARARSTPNACVAMTTAEAEQLGAPADPRHPAGGNL